MKKANVENIVKAIPDFFKNLLSYTKEHFDKNGHEALANVNGTVGVDLFYILKSDLKS